MELVKSLCISLLLTILIEVVLGMVLGIRKKREIFLVILVNVVTNPIVVLCYSIIWHVLPMNLLFWNFVPWSIWLTEFILELLAVLCEAMYYKHYLLNFKHPFWLSLVLNGISFGIGCLIV